MSRHTARIIHAAMTAGVVVIVVTFGVVRQVAPPEPLDELVWVFRLIALVNVIVVIVMARMLRSQLGPLERGEHEDAWWRAYGVPIVLVWALAEGAATVGAVFWLLTGDMPMLVGVSAVSLAVLVANRPTRIVERRAPND